MDIETKSIRADIVFLAIAFLTVFAALAIYSHSESDPGYTFIVFSNYEQSVSNLFGKTGAYISDILATFFGWTTFLLPSVLIWLSYSAHLHRKNKAMKWKRTIFRFILFLILLYLLSTLSGFLGGTDFIFSQKPTGGLWGLFSADLFSSLVGRVGGVIVCIFLILLTLLALFPRVIISFIRDGINLPKIPELKRKDGSSRVVTEDEEPDYGDFMPVKNMPSDENSPIGSLNRSVGADKDDAYTPPSKVAMPEKPAVQTVQKVEEELGNLESIAVNKPKVKEPFNHINIKEPVTMEQVIGNYTVPLSLLDEAKRDSRAESPEEMKIKGELLLSKLADFGVNGKIREIQPGPVVTQYEFEPAPGVKINKIANLTDDLALAMSAVSVRIIAPIPGKSVVGIELPNKYRAMVSLSELLKSREYANSPSPLTFAMGKDIAGKGYVSDLATMPHLLVAGTTGSGKSVAVNTLICSIIFKASPDKVKFIMVDPKMVELSVYDDIPHLAAPVVTDPRKAANVLKNVVEEMENRYSALASLKVRNIDSYNMRAENDPELPKMPYLVVIVDEFADLMLVSGKEVEQSIIRIAQMARAVGIHLVLATQRPSVNVITGIIKANMPARLSFRVSSKIDSRTILDSGGAEVLLGKGDSLFIPPGMSDCTRVHGCFVSDEEVGRIVEHLKSIGKPEYNMDLVREQSLDAEDVDDSEMDEKYQEALELVRQKGFASISMVQRYLRIGYNRAARIVEIMEKQGIVAPSDGTSKPRELLIKD
ncbi:MAG: DNA translocase FtsK 4TM domain-containing protein [Deferribacterales bacterium]